MGRCTAMCAGPSHGGNGAIRNGLKVFGSGELVWKTDVLGVRGEFRSGFQCFCAFRRRSESLQPLAGFTCELSQLRVWAISVTGSVVVMTLRQCGDLLDLVLGVGGGSR